MLGYLGYFKCKFPSPTSEDYESIVVEAQEIGISETCPGIPTQVVQSENSTLHSKEWSSPHTELPSKKNSIKKQFVDF